MLNLLMSSMSLDSLPLNGKEQNNSNKTNLATEQHIGPKRIEKNLKQKSLPQEGRSWLICDAALRRKLR